MIDTPGKDAPIKEKARSDQPAPSQPVFQRRPARRHRNAGRHLDPTYGESRAVGSRADAAETASENDQG